MPREPGQKQSSDARWRLTVAAQRGLVVAVAILGWMSRTRVDVPSVVGQSLNQAKGSIAAAKLTPGKVTHEPSTESALGTVLRQVPEPGAAGHERNRCCAGRRGRTPGGRTEGSAGLPAQCVPLLPGSRVSRPCSTRRISACRSSSLTSRPFMHFFLAQRSLVVCGDGCQDRSGAEGGAVRAGDLITRIAGAKIASVNDLRVALNKIGPGKTRFTIRRGEAELTLDVDCPLCEPS